MSVTISGVQQTRLERNALHPKYLVTLRDKTSTLRFCNDNAFTYLGNTYQPFVRAEGDLFTGAQFPINETANQEYPIELANDPIEFKSTSFTHLSHTFGSFDWELADVDVSVLLLDSNTADEDEDVATPPSFQRSSRGSKPD